MYHDQALYKEAGGGFTPWHADQFYWPLATEKCCTVWIPLQKTPLEMGPMAFAEGSHAFTYGRDLSISDESEQKIQTALSDAQLPYIQEPYDLGEVSFHYGWTFHRADGNQTDQPREVMTIIYMDVDMRLKKPDNENQKRDWDGCCPGAKIGEIINSPINPVLYEQK
jgi:ectoine hydroxylase-related dioxygenase (phytanoyl-CoA dioxygenase family)